MSKYALKPEEMAKYFTVLLRRFDLKMTAFHFLSARVIEYFGAI